MHAIALAPPRAATVARHPSDADAGDQACARPLVAWPAPPSGGLSLSEAGERQRIDASMALLEATLAPTRWLCHAGDKVYQAGQRFEHLYVANAGIFKIVNLSPDGREQMAAAKFRGDWLGLDGIASGFHGCEAVAMDTGELWVFSYQALLSAGASHRSLLTTFHEAMGRQLAHSRDSLMSVCTLPADARVANFLHGWARALAVRGQRTDQITLRMSRAEIGSHLGMTLETVSRALAHMARLALVGFPQKGRRDIAIPDLDRLAAFAQAGHARTATAAAS